MTRMRTVHHGIDASRYRLVEHKQQYLSFIGRIAPLKGTHLAIEVAKRSRIADVHALQGQRVAFDDPLLQSDDHREGLAAARERREPEFRGS